MKSKYLKIIFFGSSSYVVPIIEALGRNFDLKMVVTTEKNSKDAVLAYCIKYKIPYFSISSFSKINLKSLIINHKSIVGILADFGLIIPKKVLNLFPKGILNIHPSLLPKYRGPTPVQTAILNGEKTTGVTIIKLDNQIDHGPILAQVKEEILPEDSAQSLYFRLFKIGAKILPEVIDKYLEGKLKLLPQNHKKATFTKPLTRTDGYIDISYINKNKTFTINKIDRMIRAYYPWPGVWTKWKVDPSADGGKWKIVKFLPDNKIQVEGKNPVSYKDFVNGYPEMGKEILKRLGIKY